MGEMAPEKPVVLATAKENAKAGDTVQMKGPEEVKDKMKLPKQYESGAVEGPVRMEPLGGEDPVPVNADGPGATELERELVQEYRSTVGGYFRRFNPPYFNLPDKPGNFSTGSRQESVDDTKSDPPVTVEAVLTYAFLRADLDFVTAQARKPDPDDPYVADFPLNQDEILGSPHLPPSGHGIGGPARFKGGSTASIALISTPHPGPFWHPAARSTLLVAHVGDTRVLLCETANRPGLPADERSSSFLARRVPTSASVRREPHY